MNYFSKTEITLLILLLILVFCSVYLSRSTRLYNKEMVQAEESFEVLLYESTNVEGLVETLDSLNLSFDEEELRWAANTLGWRNYQQGRYLLSDEYSYSSFLSKLGRGIQDPGIIVIVPGMDRVSLVRRLSERLLPDSSSFSQIFEDSSEVAKDLGLTAEQLLSRMLPETYQIYWTTPAERVIRRIHSEFEKAVIGPYKNQIEENPLDLDEIITLASIVELEANLNEEKPRISGLYLNRLKKNMFLQADPTVSYALGEKRRLLYQDYEFDHPYNTYRTEGLPPGPITNPDLSSIRSVLEPEEHNYLYMVATPEGAHQFSETFSEHQQASKEWRRWIREQFKIRDEKEQEQESSSSNL